MKPALIVAAVLALALPSTASASYFVGKPVAEHYLRQVLHSNYGLTGTGVYCRPKKGRNESTIHRGRRLWHRWSCGFVAGDPGDSCKGMMSIIGSDSEAGFYYQRHWSVGESC